MYFYPLSAIDQRYTATLSRLYEVGEGSFPKDLKKAKELALALERKGTRYGAIYGRLGIIAEIEEPRNRLKHERYFRRAIELGWWEGYTGLARVKLTIPKNEEMALGILLLGENELKHPEIYRALAQYYTKTAPQPDYDRAFYCYKRMAECGNLDGFDEMIELEERYGDRINGIGWRREMQRIMEEYWDKGKITSGMCSYLISVYEQKIATGSTYRHRPGQTEIRPGDEVDEHDEAERLTSLIVQLCKVRLDLWDRPGDVQDFYRLCKLLYIIHTLPHAEL